MIQNLEASISEEMEIDCEENYLNVKEKSRKSEEIISEIKEEGEFFTNHQNNNINQEIQLTGKWSHEEHSKFIEATQKYGNNWNLVSYFSLFIKLM